jgi:hypothetical protein
MGDNVSAVLAGGGFDLSSGYDRVKPATYIKDIVVSSNINDGISILFGCFCISITQSVYHTMLSSGDISHGCPIDTMFSSGDIHGYPWRIDIRLYKMVYPEIITRMSAYNNASLNI